MKKIIAIFFIVCMILLTSVIVSGISDHHKNNRSRQRDGFSANIGFRDNENPILTLNGTVRTFRGRHILNGVVSKLDSERMQRFQGILLRPYFLLQTGFRNQIINIIGTFNSYDEECDCYKGVWRGFIIGYGTTHGWIEASL